MFDYTALVLKMGLESGKIDVWLSVGTDSGISLSTIGELGASSELLQGTLTTLKSIVTTEVGTSEESRYMTGQTDFTSYGVQNVGYLEDSVILVQYILKSKEENRIEPRDINAVEMLAASYAQQLMQSSQFDEAVVFGRAMDTDVVVKSLMNGCQITRQKLQLVEDERLLLDGTRALFFDMFNNPGSYYGIKQLKERLLKPPEDQEETVWEDGMISLDARDDLLEQIAYELLGEAVHKQPLCALFHPLPRRALDQILSDLEKHIREVTPTAEDICDEHLGAELDKRVRKLLKQLSIDDIHSADIILSHRLSSEITKALIEKRPLMCLVDFRRLGLSDEIQNRIRDLVGITTLSDVLVELIEDAASGPALRYAHSFLTVFTSNLRGQKLPAAAWTTICAYLAEILPQDDLVKQIKNLSLPVAKWKRELKARLSRKIQDQLNIRNMNEAVRFSEALEKAILDTIHTVFADQISGSGKGFLGRAIYGLVTRYKEFGPTLRVASALKELVNAFDDVDFTRKDLTAVSAADIATAAIKHHYAEYRFDGHVVKMMKGDPVRCLLPDGRQVPLREAVLFSQAGIVRNGDETPCSPAEFTADPIRLLELLSNKNILCTAFKDALERHLIDGFVEPLRNYKDSLLSKAEEAIVAMKENVSSHVDSVLTVDPLQTIEIKPPQIQIKELARLKYGEEMYEEWLSFSALASERLQKLVADFKSSGSAQKNIASFLNKFADDLNKHVKTMGKALERVLKKIINAKKKETKILNGALKSYKKRISRVIEESTSQAIRFSDVQRPTSVPDERAVISNLRLVKKIESELAEEFHRDFLHIGLAIELFGQPPRYVIDEAYGELLKGKMKRFKGVKGVATRQDFEARLTTRFQSLGRAVLDLFTRYVSLTEGTFILADGELAVDRNGLFMPIGTMSTRVFHSARAVRNITGIKNVAFSRNRDLWDVKVYLEGWKRSDAKESGLVMLSDAMRYATRNQYDLDTGPTVAALAKIASYRSPHESSNIQRFQRASLEALFRT